MRKKICNSVFNGCTPFVRGWEDGEACSHGDCNNSHGTVLRRRISVGAIQYFKMCIQCYWNQPLMEQADIVRPLNTTILSFGTNSLIRDNYVM